MTTSWTGQGKNHHARNELIQEMDQGGVKWRHRPGRAGLHDGQIWLGRRALLWKDSRCSQLFLDTCHVAEICWCLQVHFLCSFLPHWFNVREIYANQCSFVVYIDFRLLLFYVFVQKQWLNWTGQWVDSHIWKTYTGLITLHWSIQKNNTWMTFTGRGLTSM